MTTTTLIADLNNLIDQCIETPIDSILNNKDWGTINFEGCRTELKRTYDMLNHLKILPVELLPEDQTKKIISILPEIMLINYKFMLIIHRNLSLRVCSICSYPGPLLWFRSHVSRRGDYSC